MRHGTQGTRFDLGGNLGHFPGKVICLTIFSGNSFQSGFRISDPICPS
jgi:hypothetical protein